jgi:two-component system sensor histidine kinase ChiS
MQATTETSQGVVLVVDDTPANLRLLTEMLTQQGYLVRPAPNGKFALNFAHTNPPDLILLDIKMPDMDGYEVCKQLKAHEQTHDIPVIFLSALNEITDKVKGFTVGGVDYITKPFQAEEVLARVRTHLTLRRLQQDLQAKNIQLQQTNEQLEQRTQKLSETLAHLQATQQQLIQTEKMAALGQLVAGVAHEINTPVGVGVMAASFLEQETREITEAYAEKTLHQSDFEEYIGCASESSATILSNLNRIAELIHRFKQVAVDQTSEERRTFNLKKYIEDIVVSFSLKYDKTKYTVTTHCPEKLVLNNSPGALIQILMNLFDNSFLHGFEDMQQGHVTIEVEEGNAEILFRYSDDGKGMNETQIKKLFEPFFTTKRSQGRTGLGMHIVYNLVTQTLGGQIECQSEIERGTTFLITIPVGKSG